MGKFGKNTVVRALSGAVLLIIVLGAVLISEFTFAALALTICLGVMWEFFRLAKKRGAEPMVWYAMAVGTVAVVLSFFIARGSIPAGWLKILIPLVFIVFIAELFRNRKDPFLNISISLTGLIYAALPMSLLCFLAYRTGSGYLPQAILLIIFTVWMNDIFAYLTGVAIGRHKMFERISPKKSWEGFFGGLLFAVAFVLVYTHFTGGSMMAGAGFAIVVVLASVLGDFVESMFKRAVDVKDSGSILPGHGGFMDRFDALLFAVPFVYVYYYVLLLV